MGGVELNITLPYVPQDKQKLLHGAKARQIFYGGAAGGGKSHSIRWDAIEFCLSNPGLDAYLFRRTLGELEDNHIRKMRAEIPSVLGTYNETKKRFEFYNKSGLNFCYCEKEADVLRYQGAEIHWLGVDEAAHLTEYQLTYLRSRVRLGSWSPNPSHKNLLPRIVYGSNPGGPGHQFLKSTFIDPSPPMTYFRDESMADPKNPEDKGWLSVYIPARMADNLYLDKSYAGQFRALAPELARALTEGDWDAVVGAALHNLSRERHQLRGFVPPRHWTRFMALDWGTARPFSVGWYCVSDGGTLAAKDGWPERNLPPGAVIRYAEWYGTDGRPNHGSRLSADQVALGILKREKERGEESLCAYRVGDSQMWASHDGPSPRERMFVSTDGRVNLRQSKKDRKVNYAEIIARLAGNYDFQKSGEELTDPMFFVTANCVHFWRTCPPLVLDENDPDKGPGTDQEDHCLHGRTVVYARYYNGPEGYYPIPDEIKNKPRLSYLEFLPGDAEVLTTTGWQKVIHLGRTGTNKPIWRLETEGGGYAYSTSNHPFLCKDGKYRPLKDLRVGMKLMVSEQWRNISTERPTGSADSTISERGSDSTARSGSTTTVQSPKATTFITETATGETILSRIWNYFRGRGTSRITASSASNMGGCKSSASVPSPQNGTDQKKGSVGIRSAGGSTLLPLSNMNTSASNAAKRKKRASPPANTAGAPVSNGLFAVKILAITRAGNADVFNLHVLSDEHNFLINGGLVTHNCYDEVAYGLASRPFTQTKEEFENIGRPRKRIDPYATA